MAAAAAPPPPLQLRAAQPDDVPRLAHLLCAAFTPIMPNIFPSGHTAADEALRRAQLARRLAERDARPQRAFVDVAARAADGRVLAFVQWRLLDAGGYDAPAPAPEQAQAQAQAQHAAALPWPADAQPQLHEAFFQRLEMSAKQHMNDRPHAHIDILCVDSETARTGAGTFLFQHVLAHARAQRVPIYLDAAPTGSALPFWTRHGFRQLGVIHFDGMDDVIAMLREDDSTQADASA